MRRNLVTRADFVLDGTVEIGKGRVEHRDQLLEALPIGWHAPRHGVGDAVRCHQFIHDGKRALVEGVVEDAADEGSGAIR